MTQAIKSRVSHPNSVAAQVGELFAQRDGGTVAGTVGNRYGTHKLNARNNYHLGMVYIGDALYYL